MTSEEFLDQKLVVFLKSFSIYESLFRSKRKYHRGRLLLGGVNSENVNAIESRRLNYGERINEPRVVEIVEEDTNNL